MRLRSLLFAPAAQPDLVRKLPRAGADGVVIDCEDGTPVAGKAAARGVARTVGDEIAGSTSVWVRINGSETPYFHDDVRHALGTSVSGIVVPVVESGIQLDAVRHAITGVGRQDLPIIAGLETARGVAGAQEILTHPGVVAGYFGAEDFIADMGGVRTDSNAEVFHARSHVALAGRLAQVPVLDQVVVAFADRDRFQREAEEARSLGFAGKMCIHPGQVALAHDVFTPSAAEVDHARRIVEEHRRGLERGLGVVVVDGRMIDEPLVMQARRILDSAG